MAIVKMKKVAIVALDIEKNEIISALHAFGALHVVADNSNAPYEHYERTELLSSLENDLIKIKNAIDFLCKYSDMKKTPQLKHRKIDAHQFNEIYNNRYKFERIADTCSEMDKIMADIKNRIVKLEALEQTLRPWLGLKEPLERFGDTKNVKYLIGTVTNVQSLQFLERISEIGHLISVDQINMDRDQTYYRIACHVEVFDDFKHILKAFSINRLNFDGLVGTVTENLDSIRKEISFLKAEQSKIIDEIREMTSNLESGYVLTDVLSAIVDSEQVKLNFLKTKKIFIVQAWIPVELIDALKHRIEKVTNHYAIKLLTPEPDEIMPTLLKNHRYVKPLEFITEQYSVPSATGIDPNAIMMPFFIIFFGIMVSDAIYGLIILTFSALILKRIQPNGDFKKILGILFLGGFSTAFWGVMFGGWLGGMISVSAILFDPLNEPFKMIGMCLIFGTVHLFVGFGLQAYMNVKRGYILDAILDQGLWVLFILSIMSLSISEIAPYNKFVAIGLAIGLILTQGRHKKNPIMKLLSGVLSLYNLTGFLGDVLSYLRLFALGLATGVIGTVINSMASMLSGSIIGSIFMIVILIIGHTFNIAINVLGAYVHSSRLQYVEFFSKFYEGDGIKYNPFRIKAKFVDLKAMYDKEVVK